MWSFPSSFIPHYKNKRRNSLLSSNSLVAAPLSPARFGTNVRQPVLTHGTFHLPPHFINLMLLFGNQGLLCLEMVIELGNL